MKKGQPGRLKNSNDEDMKMKKKFAIQFISSFDFSFQIATPNTANPDANRQIDSYWKNYEIL
ncbi:hypothetical protein [Burkholderia guangdongensis]|uniref:hypothetical protein n=1 Tax=Burkholderia guangdongensis TaxID=1792500 RepID=UPI0015CE6A46|nr:hypothetical protein [Burkholderia guangdongensis]